MENIHNLNPQNRVQILREADNIRYAIDEFNEKSPIYKIRKMALASHKLCALFGDEDAVYVSFRSIENNGFIDTLAKTENSPLQTEIVKANVNKVMEDLQPLLEGLKESGILKIKPFIDLEDSKFFKKNAAKIIFNEKGYNNKTPLEKSWNMMQDAVEDQLKELKMDWLKDRAAKATEAAKDTAKADKVLNAKLNKTFTK